MKVWNIWTWTDRVGAKTLRLPPRLRLVTSLVLWVVVLPTVITTAIRNPDTFGPVEA